MKRTKRTKRTITAICTLLLAWQAGASLAAPAPAASPRLRAEIVSFPVGALTVPGWWIRADDSVGPNKKPTVIALHGCGGLYSVIRGTKSEFTPRHIGMAKMLNRAGYNVLFPDSYTPRNKKAVCRDDARERRVSAMARRSDVQAALRWLAQQKDVDTSRIALVGWGDGAAAVLTTLNAALPGAVQLTPKPAAGAAFYPDCREDVAKGAAPFRSTARLLILMGAEDDWTPPQACTDLEKRQSSLGPGVEVQLYADSHHEFDAPGQPMLVRMDIDNGGPGGKGVTVGSNSETGPMAYRDMLDFLQAELK